MSDRDHIVAPAIRVNGVVHAAPRPADDDGVNEMRHRDAMNHAVTTGKATPDGRHTEVSLRRSLGAFTDVYDRLSKGPTTMLYRRTSTPPDETGTMRFRPDPKLGATYFANTPQGTSSAAQSGKYNDGFVGATAITRQTHRIFGHNLPRKLSEEQAQAQLAHFNRIADRAPHPVIGEMIRTLAKHAIDRDHEKVTEANGKSYRVYGTSHAPIHWTSFDDAGTKVDPDVKVDANNTDAGNLPTSWMKPEETTAVKNSHPAHAPLRSTVQMALHHMGYDGAAVQDEAGVWTKPSRVSARNQGSIALLPKASAKMSAKVVKPAAPIDAIVAAQAPPAERLPGRLPDIHGLRAKRQQAQGEGPVVKSLASFEEIENHKSDEWHGVQVRVMHPNGQQGMDVHLMRGHEDPEGHWSLVNVDPVDTTRTIDGHAHSRAFANRLGPAIVRQTARHLKEKYGITNLRGFRVSGARFANQPDDADSIEARDSQRITVSVAKAIPTITTLRDDQYPEHEMHVVKLQLEHPDTGQRVHMQVTKRGEAWELDDIGPIDDNRFISYKPKTREYAGSFGVEAMRHVARHLHKTYGITKLSAQRVTGTKSKDWNPDTEMAPNVEVNIAKAIQAFKTSIGRDVPDLDAAKTVGGQLGTNPGRMVEHKGQRWYLKQYDRPEQAYGEKLANEVYRAAGINAPRTAVIQHGGKHHLASKVIEGFEDFSRTPMQPEHAKQLTHGFAADVLLANWDAHGNHGDNVGRINNGTARIDQGGALLSRGLQGLKSPESLRGITEVERFGQTRSTYNPILATAGTTPEQLERTGAIRQQVQKLSDVRDAHGGWEKFVDRHIPTATPELRQRFSSLLNERHAHLEARFTTPVTKSLGAFDALVERLEKRVTNLYRVTQTPPDASGRMRFRENPQLGVTYFANTAEGAHEAAQSSGAYTGVTAITRQHRIFGHNLQTRVPEAKVQAHRAHFERLAQSAPHPAIASAVKWLANRVLDRTHVVETDASGNKYRVYASPHAPISFMAFDSDATVPAKTKDLGFKNVLHHALHHMGFHGAAISDEAGNWAGSHYGKRLSTPQGSIALLPHVSSKMTARHQPDSHWVDRTITNQMTPREVASRFGHRVRARRNEEGQP